MNWLSEIWVRVTGSDAIVAAFLSVLIPPLVLAIGRWFAPRTRLRYGILSNHVLLPNRADGSPGVLRIQRIQISNGGSRAAEDVEVMFNWKPQHIEQYPHVAFGDVIKGDGRYIVQIPRLNGKESMVISMASDGPDLPSVIYVRGKNAKAKLQHFRELVWLPLGWRIFVFVLLFLGFFTLIYLIIVSLGWVLFGRVPQI